jgi:hypothetical protein
VPEGTNDQIQLKEGDLMQPFAKNISKTCSKRPARRKLVQKKLLFADDPLAFPSCFSTPIRSLEQLLWQPDESLKDTGLCSVLLCSQQASPLLFRNCNRLANSHLQINNLSFHVHDMYINFKLNLTLI